MKKDIHTTPKSMNINVMRQLLQNFLQNNPNFYQSREFAISTRVDFFEKILEVFDEGPFFVEDYRMGMVVRGTLDVTTNLIDYHVTEGQIVFIGRGSIVHINRIEEGTIVKVFILSADLVNHIFPDNNLSLISNTATAFLYEASADDRKFFDNILLTIWSLVHPQPSQQDSENYPTEVLHALFAALLNYYNHLHATTSNLPQNTANLFNQFISLVNQYSDRERSIPFYADRLCLSPRYFSTLIQQQSGKPAKHWIDASVVTRAKVMLRHTPKTISQISTELNFPNDSFFCKFFRRMTGMSPTEYRE